MAGTWAITIEVLDLAAKRLTIRATRSEGDPPDEVERTYTVQTHYDTGKSKADNLQDWGREIWKLYQNDLTQESGVSGLVLDCETLLANGLNAEEA